MFGTATFPVITSVSPSTSDIALFVVYSSSLSLSAGPAYTSTTASRSWAPVFRSQTNPCQSLADNSKINSTRGCRTHCAASTIHRL
ncbi:unnamed protein product [Mycena citricolor]|uniref:Uncharacterized protein n=1 Tax=Mycena citricolor TaxID=2018698 RepID=A0AAD2HZA0_9AGAR|nr:unnamed protein product [Mycena citricolor]